MCGIAGLLTSSGRGEQVVASMIAAITHRGPDDDGSWTDIEAGVTLGHRRLSIVDLSPLGRQPMASNDRRYVLSFNGEIYNHAALRRELDGPWRGSSDTETLVAAIAAWGLTKALQKSVGMFALALWDRSERRLLLARDRFGEKPLYYGRVGGDFVFASELKAIRTHPDFANPIDRSALRLFAARGYIPAPLSIYEGISKLEPGSILGVRPGNFDAPSIEKYWSYRDIVRTGLRDPIADEGEALHQLEAGLADAITGQAVADVPVGAFLSGGIDSSTVVALYRKYASGAVRTFSIGFEETAFNEAPFAAEVARHFGTDHNERIVTVAETRDVIPLLPAMYDEPFADASQIPTHLVARFAREQVTVALSGDAGDELFGGYNRYLGAASLWSNLQKLPRPLRAGLGGGAGRLSASTWQTLAKLLPGTRQPHFGTKVQKALRTMGGAASLNDVYDSFLDEWAGEASPVLGGRPAPSAGFDMDAGVDAPDVVRMMYCDATSYLPDDILCKVDRAAMAVSLETRVPFLDHRVAEIAARIPLGMKIRGGQGKWILRQLLYREAPRRLFERPKTGFAIPVGEWLRGPLRPWAEELLDERRLRHEGFFDAARIRGRWAEHISGQRDSTQALWAVLMFQSWHAENATISRPAPAPHAAVAARTAAG